MWNLQGLLNFIVTIVSVSTHVMHLALLLSYNIGQMIVKFAYTFAVGVCSSVETLLIVLRVLYEDYCIFIVDVLNKIVHIVSVIGHILKQLLFYVQHYWNVLKSFVFGVFQLFELCISTVYATVMKVVCFLVTIPELVKHALILIGCGIWYIVQLIPLTIVYIITMLIYFAGRSYDEVYSLTCTMLGGLVQVLNNIAHIFFDFPVEALFGLCVGGLMCVAAVKYGSQLTYYGIHFFDYFQRQIRQFPGQLWNGLEMLMFWSFVRENNQVVDEDTDHSTDTEDRVGNFESNNPDATLTLRSRSILRVRPSKRPSISQEQSVKQLAREQDSNLCVVCHDEEKCVVILPCRHVCLCKRCCIIIQRGSCDCPICRHPMRSTMSVYL